MSIIINYYTFFITKIEVFNNGQRNEGSFEKYEK
jgi:hypothetical protein